MSVFPDDFLNDVNGWAFSKEVIDQDSGKLLTLDLDFGSYCSLNCPTCFRKSNSVDDHVKELQFEDLQELILDAKKLGLRSVKFLGAGDPMENPGFLDFLRFLHDVDVIPLIFTKGQVIGDDEAVRRHFGKYRINTGAELCHELYKLGASVLVSVNSFDDKTQGNLVGRNRSYIHIRNRAIECLVEAGFTRGFPTRLAIINSPVTKQNIADAFEIYKWGRLRNMYSVVTPSMISGRAESNGVWRKVQPLETELLGLYVKIYKFNIDTNLQTLAQIKAEGIATYAGGHPCNQVSTGLYVSLNGVVLSCPGSETQIEGNVWNTDLETIWMDSANRKRAGTFNNGCIAKEGYSIPTNFFEKVLAELC